MFGLRSARSRAIVAGAVLLVLLASFAALAIRRAHELERQHDSLQQTSTVATALEHARAQLFQEELALSALVFSGDPSLVQVYQEAAAALEQDLSRARAGAMAEGDADEVLALDDLAARIRAFNEEIARRILLLLALDPETRVLLASAARTQMTPEVDAFTAELDRLAESERSQFAARTAAADRSVDMTLWLFIGFGAAGLLVTVGTVALLVVSVVRPLAALRARARAITAGDLQVRADVSGPEEIASLARDFNEMTDALSRKTEEYIATANLTGDIIVRLDKDGRCTFVNDAACQFFGRPVEEMLGAGLEDYLHPDDAAAATQALRDMIDGKELTRGFVNRWVTPRGTRVVEWNGYPLFDEQGQYLGFQATGRDITERQRMQKELRESEEKYRRLVEDSIDGIGIIEGLEVRFVNRATVEMFGYETEEEMLGRPFTDFLPPEWRQPLADRTHARQAGGDVPSEYELRGLRKDGTPFDAEVSVVTITYQGRPAVQAIVRDVTERKQMEEALQESESRYRLLAENATDVIWTMDLNLRFTYVSPSITGLRGYTVDEIMAQRIEEVLTPASLEVARKALADELAIEETGEKDLSRSRTLQLEHPCKDGSTVWVEAKMRFLRDPDGQPLGILGVSRDITERKRMEEELRESEEKCRRLVEDSIDGIAIVDGLELRFVNRAILEMFGYQSEQELVGHPFTDFISPEYRELMLQRAYARQAGEDLPSRYEFKALRKDGSEFSAEVSVGTIAYQGHAAIQAIVRDITERKRMEEALQESESRYRLLAENATDIIWTMDLGLRYTYVSPSVERMRGYTAEELVGKTVQETLTPPSLELARKTLAEELAREKAERRDVFRSRTLELEMYCRDGSTVWTEVKVAFLRDPDGQPVGLLGVTRDISERKRAEEELHASEERFKTLFEFAPDGYYLIDLEGNFVEGNRVAEQIVGCKKEELIGKNALEAGLLPPEEIATAATGLAKNAQGLPTGPDEFTMIRKDGTQVPVEIRTLPVKIKEQTLVLGIARDITERKRAEEALRESEERFRSLSASAPIGIFLTDAQGNCIYANPRLQAIAGLTLEESLGYGWSKVIHPDDRGALLEEASKAAGQGHEFSYDFRIVTREGELHWAHVHTSPMLSTEGEVMGRVGTIEDITERKRAEEERERLHAELEARAITDSLTGLYDHAHFYQRLAEELERSRRYNHGFAVVMMDVDDFKRFNDSRGHQAGDEMLRFVGDCIRSGLRRSDIAFRYGGDEFAAILPHADSSKARGVVKRINGRITEALKEMDKGGTDRLTLSAGVACFPEDGTTADDLVRIADAALYSAKWVARARDIMGQREDIQSLVSALVSRRAGVETPAGGPIFRPEALHEQRARIVSSVASSIAVALIDAGVAQALEDPDLQILAVVGAAAEIKDRYIRGHPERTSQGAVALAEKMGLSPERVRDIRVAGLLHDIGKVTVSEGILNKPGKLTRREFATIKEHPIVGATLVSQVRGFERLVPTIRHHHERFDGKGYPDGLAGEDIPLEARILSVVDVFDAMTHQRAYRKALSREEAVAELERGAGTQFDALVVQAFVAWVGRRGEKLAAPAQSASEDRQLAASRAPGRGKG